VFLHSEILLEVGVASDGRGDLRRNPDILDELGAIDMVVVGIVAVFVVRGSQTLAQSSHAIPDRAQRA